MLNTHEDGDATRKALWDLQWGCEVTCRRSLSGFLRHQRIYSTNPIWATRQKPHNANRWFCGTNSIEQDLPLPQFFHPPLLLPLICGPAPYPLAVDTTVLYLLRRYSHYSQDPACCGYSKQSSDKYRGWRGQGKYELRWQQGLPI